MEQALAVSSSRASRRRGILRARSLKIAVALIAVGAVAFGSVPLYANAQGVLAGIFNLGYAVIAKIVFGLAYIASIILGLIIGVAAFLVSVMLNMNSQITATAFVTTGFNTTLSVANLGFVIGMVVMAIMTILRVQSYGVKQMLWRIVVMAILVNFGLVIAGSILGLANSLTAYWLQSTAPPGLSGAHNFATALAGAFNPQQSFTDITNQEFTGDAFSNVGAGIAKFFQPIASLIITIFTLLIIIIVLVTFTFLLLVRYVILNILLVLLPLAWVSWVFPLTRKNWESWWHTFLNQTFFAPIVVFFLWLVITTGKNMGNVSSELVQVYDGSNPISSALGSLVQAAIGPLAQGVVFAGLAVGGLIASQKMGISFASHGVNAAQALGKSFGGYVGRRARQAATTPFRSERGQQLANKLSTVGAGRGFLGRLATLPVRYAGQGMGAIRAAGGEKAVEEAKKRYGGMTMDQKINAVHTATAPDRISLLKEIHDAGRLSEVKNVEKYLSGDKKAEFARYGAIKSFSELRNGSGLQLAEYIKDLEKIGRGEKVTRKDDDGKEKEVSREDVEDEIKNHFRTAPNAGALAETFFTADIGKAMKDFREKGSTEEFKKAVSKSKIPFGLSADSLDKLQQQIARGVGEGFTASNASAFFSKITRGDNLEQFQNAATRVPGSAIVINEGVSNWLRGSGARNLGISKKTFGKEDDDLDPADREKKQGSGDAR
jgi:hypothetical protein